MADRGCLTGLVNLQPNVDEVRIYEARIAIQLDCGEAIYCDQLKRLYFFDSSDKPIGATLSSVLHGMGRHTEIQPVLIDEHGFIAVGKRIDLEENTLVPVFAALRLIGVKVTRGISDVLQRAGY